MGPGKQREPLEMSEPERASSQEKLRFSIEGREMEGTTELVSRIARLRAKFEDDEEGSGAGATKPSNKTEADLASASRFARLRAKFEEGRGGDVTEGSGAGATMPPKTEVEEKPFETDLGFARVRDDPTAPGGMSITLDKKYMYMYAVLGSGIPKRSTSKAAGGGVPEEEEEDRGEARQGVHRDEDEGSSSPASSHALPAALRRRPRPPLHPGGRRRRPEGRRQAC